MLEVLNEPVQDTSAAPDLTSIYYPAAIDAVRTVETSLSTATQDHLTVMMMSKSWGVGDPVAHIAANLLASSSAFTTVAFDDHRYLKWDSSVPVDHASYLAASCADNRGDASDTRPTIVGEFSLSPPDDVQDTDDWKVEGNEDFYRKWFAAQAMAYEKSNGWVFWSWKADLNDERWSYKEAVAKGIVPQNLDDVYNAGAC